MRMLHARLAVLLLGLTACNTTSVDLPLADNSPTFLFFYTDG
ncbi:MAG: hypothetical protein WBC91_19870 [Phototrophicaceae bacterium]